MRFLTRVCIAVLHLTAVAVAAPVFSADFKDGHLGAFVPSAAGRYAEQPVEVLASPSAAGEPITNGLVLKAPARHYAVTAPFSSPLTLSDDLPLVLQYEFETREGLSCGGGYVKLLLDPLNDAGSVTGDSPYAIMFGPDRCGSTDKVHVIIRRQNPVSGEWAEHHAMSVPRTKSDRLPHLYTLAIRPNGTFVISIDGARAKEGNLTDSFAPSMIPPAEIDDASDVKPSDWVDVADMEDPDARKPDDWDEDAPASIPDPDAVKPAGWLDDAPASIPDPAAARPVEWDEEEDGTWEAPLIDNPACESAPGCGPWTRPTKPNPAYRGKWRAPRIPNPAYKGVWKPRQVPNPTYYEDDELWRLQGRAMGALAVEVWTMSGGLAFYNFHVGRDEAEAAALGAATWQPRFKLLSEAAKVEAEAATRAARAEAAKTGTLLEKAAHWAMTAVEAAREHAVEVAIGGVAAFVALLGASWYLCCSASSTHGDSVASDAADVLVQENMVLQKAAAAAAAAVASANIDTVTTSTSSTGNDHVDSSAPVSTKSTKSTRSTRSLKGEQPGHNTDVSAATVDDSPHGDEVISGGDDATPPTSGGGGKSRDLRRRKHA